MKVGFQYERYLCPFNKFHLLKRLSRMKEVTSLIVNPDFSVTFDFPVNSLWI